MLFMAVTVVLGVLMYLFVQRVVVMFSKPVGIAGVDEAIDQLIERQKAKSEREEARKRRKAERSWASTTLSEHTMEIIESLEATTCPTERSQACSTATPLQQQQQSCGSSWAAASRTASTAVSAADPTTARSMGSAAGGKKGETPLEFDKTFDPKEAVVRKEQEEGVKKAHRHHHKHHHRHRSRAGEKESKERSEDSSEEGDEERKSKGGHQKRRHKRHRSKDAAPVPRLDTPIAVAGETLPVPDGVDVEMRGQEPLTTP